MAKKGERLASRKAEIKSKAAEAKRKMREEGLLPIPKRLEKHVNPDANVNQKPARGTKIIRLCQFCGSVLVAEENTNSYCTKEHEAKHLKLLGLGFTLHRPDRIYEDRWATEELFEYIKTCSERTRLNLIESSGNKPTPFTTVELPSKEGFSLWLGISVKMMDEYTLTEPALKDAIDYITTVQKQYLLNFGLAGIFNPAVTNRVLSASHDMNDKREEMHKHQMMAFVQSVYEEADRLSATRIYETETSS